MLLLHLHLQLKLLHLKLLQLLHHGHLLLLHYHGCIIWVHWCTSRAARRGGSTRCRHASRKWKHSRHESHHAHTWQTSSSCRSCDHGMHTGIGLISTRKEHGRELDVTDSTVTAHLQAHARIVSKKFGVKVAAHLWSSCHSCKSPSI